jgi:hypothetical protein
MNALHHTSAEHLYELLPAIYRIRDAERGEPLKALLEIIAEQVNLVEDNIAQSYDNWFIETCEEWLVPYIGDLLGVRPLHPVPSANVSLRGYVANTLAYRRRKGTAAVLEQLAFDTTGWRASAIEFFQRLATTQHVNHVRLNAPGWASMRNASGLERVGGPFEHVPYSAEVRRIATRGGKYNIPNLGLFLWRLQSYFLWRVTAREISAGKYTFNPLGLDVPLFNAPQTETTITHLAEEINVPTPLRRRPLYDELESFRQALANSQKDKHKPVYFTDSPVLEVFLDDVAVKPEEMLMCHLESWHVPANTKSYTRFDAQNNPVGTEVFPIHVAVDPVLGRLTLATGVSANHVEVSYSYGFSGDIGGGPYNRQAPVNRQGADLKRWQRLDVWQVGVSQHDTAVATETMFTTMSAAVQAWNTWSAANPGKAGVIVVMDNSSYKENLTGAQRIKIPEGSQLLIVAADWPTVFDASTTTSQRKPGQFVPEELRPYLQGDISVLGTAGSSKNPGRLVLNGFLIEGAMNVLEGNLGELHLSHCTLVPTKGDLSVNPSSDETKRNSSLQVYLERSIVGDMNLPDSVPFLHIRESIIDGSILALGSQLEIEASTMLGTTKAKTLEASNSIFIDSLTIERRQTGCVRFCFVPEGSITPRRYRCQPDLEIAVRSQQLEQDLARKLSPAEHNALEAEVRAWLVPSFTLTVYGQPAYGQLSLRCPQQITKGAEDGAEMGVFKFLMQPQREANLRIVLEEYLRVGLEAGLFYES